MKKLIAAAAVALVALAVVLWAVPVGQSAVPAAPPTVKRPSTILGVGTAPAVSSGHLIVHIKGKVTDKKLQHIFASADTSAGAVSVLDRDTLTWQVPKGRSDATFAKQLLASGEIAYASPDYIRQLVNYIPPNYSAPTDPAFTDPNWWHRQEPTGVEHYYPQGKSWGLIDINAAAAWQEGYTGPNIAGKHPLRAAPTSITVGVIDSGLYSNHEDIVPPLVVPKYDFFASQNPNGSFNERPNYAEPIAAWQVTGTDDLGKIATVSHGTCVAGEIGAALSNGKGTVGDGYEGSVYVYKVLGVFNNRQSGIPDTVLIRAIKRAADDGCKVISMSLSGPSNSPALQSAIDYAYGKGCVIVAAKGNNGQYGTGGIPQYPGASNHVISVGALDKDVNGTTIPASFSSYYNTSGLDIMAPGTMIWGLIRPNYDADADSSGGIHDVTLPGYFWWDGTSMATPLVAGAVAYLWRAAPGLSNAEITQAIANGAQVKGPAPHFPSGYSELDMAGAYATLEAEYPYIGNPTVSAPATSSPGVHSIPVSWTPSPVNAASMSYDILVDGSPVAAGLTTTSTTVHAGYGAHTLKVVAHSLANWDDGTASATVGFTVVKPPPPTVTDIAYDPVDNQLTFTGNDSGRPYTTTATVDGVDTPSDTSTCILGPLASGSHAATITVTDPEDSLDSSATFVFSLAKPVAAFSAPTPSAGFSFTPYLGQQVSIATTLSAPGGPYHGTPVTLLTSDDGSTFATSAITVTDNGDGTYVATDTPSGEAYYKFVFDGDVTYAGSRAPAAHVKPHTGATTWSAAHAYGNSLTSVIVGYHQTTYFASTLSNYVPAGLVGAAPTLQASTNGAPFSTVAGAVVEDLGGGVYRAHARPERSTLYRFAFAGNGLDLPSVSSAYFIAPMVSLSTPYSSSYSRRAGVYFGLSGKLLPAHSTSSRVVRLIFTRWNGHTWATYGSAWTRVVRKGSYSTYSASVKLKRGTYHVVAYDPADTLHAATTSAYRKLSVR